LKPNLGIVLRFSIFVIADIPGIIEGAAEGKDWDIIFTSY
jgi:GTPase involved in cell partitioning and DNA repair